MRRTCHPSSDELVALGPVAVEARPEPVVGPAVDLDGDPQLGVGQVQVAAAPADADPHLLAWDRQPGRVERPQHPRLEVAVARVVALPPLPKHLVHGGQRSAGRRPQPMGALGDLWETDQPAPEQIIDDAAELGGRAATAQVDDEPRRRRHGDPVTGRKVGVEQHEAAVARQLLGIDPPLAARRHLDQALPIATTAVQAQRGVVRGHDARAAAQDGGEDATGATWVAPRRSDRRCGARRSRTPALHPPLGSDRDVAPRCFACSW